MPLLLNPLLEGLKAARQAAPDIIRQDDEVTVEDQIDRWIFEFIPHADTLGGGAKVSIAKDNLRVLSVVRSQ